MVWRITHYPPGDAPSREYAVRAPSLEAAKRKLRGRPRRSRLDTSVTHKEAP